MRKRSAGAILAVVSLAGAVLLAPQSASAQSLTFPNTSVGTDTGNLHISSLDVKYDPASISVVVHLVNFTGPGYKAEFGLLDGPLTISTGKLYDAQGSTSTGPAAPVSVSVAGSSGAGSATALSSAGVSITSDLAAQTVTFTAPSSVVSWTGGIYVIANVTDDSDNAKAYNYPNGSTTVSGVGPVFNAATPTTTTVSLTSPSQVFGSTPAAVVITVSPANSGAVALVEGLTTVASAPLTNGNAVIVMPASLPSGSHTFTVVYTPTNAVNVAASSSTSFAFTIIPAPSTPVAGAAAATKTTLRLSKKTQTFKKNSAKVSVSVSGKPAGKVAIYDGKKKLKTISLKGGKASYTLSKKLKRGTHKIKVVYTPTDKEAFTTSTSKTLTLKVTK